MSERLGFIGLGIMGAGMAGNLLAAGHEVTVYNRTAARTQPLVERGASAAGSPRELAERSEIVFVCVSDTPDVEQVLFGSDDGGDGSDAGGSGGDGVAAGLAAGGLVVDMSTVNPQATLAWAARLAERQLAFVDAPVSGGSEGAANGTLSIMAGGSAVDFERVRPYLQAMGTTLTHVGPVGSGQTCKLVNQILVVGNMLAASEALVFAKAGGLDLAKTIAAVEGGAAGSWMLSKRGPQVIARDWRPGFTIDLQQKDLRLVAESAESFGVPTIMTSTIAHLYRTLQREGLGAEGNHALVKALERLSGFTASQDDG